MGKILTREEAWALLNEYNKEPFHLRHGETVEGVMRYLAQELGYGDEVDFWGNVGLLHDLDFEQWPEEHCAKVQELMRERDIDERMIHAVASHGYGICCDIEPEHEMEKVLFAVDELTGLIGAAAHPLNLPVFENGAARPSFGFSIIAPRMAATSRSAAESGFAASLPTTDASQNL